MKCNVKECEFGYAETRIALWDHQKAAHPEVVAQFQCVVEEHAHVSYDAM